MTGFDDNQKSSERFHSIRKALRLAVLSLPILQDKCNLNPSTVLSLPTQYKYEVPR
jgi:hypothetical protein